MNVRRELENLVERVEKESRDGRRMWTPYGDRKLMLSAWNGQDDGGKRMDLRAEDVVLPMSDGLKDALKASHEALAEPPQEGE